jgi:hypothetical protein
MVGSRHATVPAMNGPTARRADAAMRAVMRAAPALVAASFAAAHGGNVADAAHDGGVDRVLGLGPDAWRSLDVAAGAILSAAPLGTCAGRAALGGCLVAAATAVVLYEIVACLLGQCAPTRRLRFVIAAIATAAPLVGAPWQSESAAVGGSVVGALLVLLTLASVARAAAARERSGGAPWPWALAALGLAIGYEPLVGAAAFAGFAAFVGASAAARRGLWDACRASRGVAVGGAFLAGLGPFVLALVHARAAGVPVENALGNGWLGEPSVLAPGHASRFLRADMGLAPIALAIVGTGLATLVARARPLAAALVAVAATGALASSLGVPAGPSRYGAPILAAIGATFALAAVAMQAVVRIVAAARVPLARASATMVVVLELVLPVDAADDALARKAAPDSDPASVWDDSVWGSLPPATVAIVDDPRIYSRALAARAEGELRGDLVVVAADAPSAFEGRVFAGQAALLPLWRDLALTGVPTEASLSSLASTRPVAVAYEARWGYAIGRHLLPLELLDRFEPEPRGASDRRRALDAFAAARERLAATTRDDPELAAASASLLRARAVAEAAGGDRDLAARTLFDLRVFAP